METDEILARLVWFDNLPNEMLRLLTLKELKECLRGIIRGSSKYKRMQCVFTIKLLVREYRKVKDNEKRLRNFGAYIYLTGRIDTAYENCYRKEEERQELEKAFLL